MMLERTEERMYGTLDAGLPQNPGGRFYNSSRRMGTVDLGHPFTWTNSGKSLPGIAVVQMDSSMGAKSMRWEVSRNWVHHAVTVWTSVPMSFMEWVH